MRSILNQAAVNLRQSGDTTARVLVDTRVRKGPYWHLSEKQGVWCYSIHSGMYRPRAYVREADGGLLKEYEYLTNAVTLWDAATERQICIKGPDALAFADLLVTRDLVKTTPVGQCRYVLLCYEDGGIVNDPVLLRVAEDEIWLSTHTEVLPWARGVAYGSSYDVAVDELDVGPIQVQGPYSRSLMERLVAARRLGREVLQLRYYGCCSTRLDGVDIVVSRTGFTAEVGYEVYPHDATRTGERVWNALLEAGDPFGVKVIAPSHIRRLEAGILSYGADMDASTNPYEVGLGALVHLDKIDFIGKTALERVAADGVTRKLVGLVLGGQPITWYNTDFWMVMAPNSGGDIGYVTSAFYSPKLETNIGFAMLPAEAAEEGTRLAVRLPDEPDPVVAEVVRTPFYDPQKRMPVSA